MSNQQPHPDERDAVPAELAVASPERIAHWLEDAHPADAAELLSRLSRGRAAEAAQHLDPTTAALLFREMHAVLAASVVAEMEAREASMVLAEMAPDDRVDILNHLPAPLREGLVRELGDRTATEVRQLACYPGDSAGGIMTTEAISLPRSDDGRAGGRGTAAHRAGSGTGSLRVRGR